MADESGSNDAVVAVIENSCLTGSRSTDRFIEADTGCMIRAGFNFGSFSLVMIAYFYLCAKAPLFSVRHALINNISAEDLAPAKVLLRHNDDFVCVRSDFLHIDGVPHG